MTEPFSHAQISDLDLYDRERAASALSDDKAIPHFKQLLSDANDILISRFDTGTDVQLLLQQRAWLIDQILGQIWQHQTWPSQPQRSLIAAGGYGRNELNLFSDIDILLLFSDQCGDETNRSIERFLTTLWDIGLEIGHSVRTVDECILEASKDVTIATNLLEARTIVGENNLLDAVSVNLQSNKVWPGTTFFTAKRDEQAKRHERHADTEYNLEPNLKLAPGGLRDVQTIVWISRWYFDCSNLQDLITKHLLTDEELALLESSRAFLWRIRFALHSIARRDENRLLFDNQRLIAARLGYKDSEEKLGVEKFMQRYYRTVMALAEFNTVLLQHFEEVITHSTENATIEPVNARFQIHNGYMEVTNPKVFEETPSALLELFVLMGQRKNTLGVRARTVRLLFQNHHRIDENFRKNPINIALFADFLRSPHALYSQLRRMKSYGVLGRYIPAFDNIIGQSQFDMFHIYTVDAHTLFVIKNMRRFILGKDKEKQQLASNIVQHLPKIELLYIAGLFHDIAKGRGGDHSELGSTEAKEFCLHHNFTRWDANLVAWLVSNHLIMSVTAQKKDIADPDIVNEFAQLVGDQIRLDYLYALTVADICATNPKLWNGWRASLMRQLYVETKRALRRGLENPIDKQDWIDETRSQALVMIEKNGIELEQIDSLWKSLGDDYFLRHTSKEIAWHAKGILTHGDSNEPLIMLQESDDRTHEGATEIFIYSSDQPNLFAASVAAIDQLGLTILDARIMSSELNFSLDTYIVLNENNIKISDKDRIHTIKQTLEETLRDQKNYPDVVQRRLSRRLKSFSVGTAATISNNLNLGVSIVEVGTLDRPGLLAQIGEIFSEFNINVKSARITTLGERAEDFFFITDLAGDPLSDPNLCEEIIAKLHKELDDDTQP